VPGLGTLPLGAAGIPFALLFVVWVTNLYNFMDGMDGFAGGMACSGFLLLAILGWREGRETFALLATTVATAHLGFLVLNFPPARIFLGDAGSIPAGFLAAGFSLWGVREAVFPLWVPLLAFSPFIVDATVTVLRRFFRRERVWEAPRSHYYQRLVLAGWSHRRTVLAEYGLMLAATLSAAGFGFFPHDRWAGLGIAGWIVIYFALAFLVRRVEMRRGSRTQ